MTPTHPLGALTVELRTWRIGRYTVRQRARFDNPYWPQYTVMLGEQIIGKQLSMPGLSDCEWLAQQRDSRIRYGMERPSLTLTQKHRRYKAAKAHNDPENWPELEEAA